MLDKCHMFNLKGGETPRQNHSFAWSGKMPNTGIYKCIYCGKEPSHELTRGKEYYQRHCGVWLTYTGIDTTDPRFHNFKKDGKIYNQLFNSDIENMFDFSRHRKSTI